MPRLDLVADCSRCSGLCCIAPAFDASEDFAFDKPAGARCQHLTAESRCAIHPELAQRGFRGCVLYDCFGAGQRATVAWGGPEVSERRRHQAFMQLREVHELLWLLTQAAELCPAREIDLAKDLAREIAALDALPLEPAAAFLNVDVTARRQAATAVLQRVGTALGGRQALAAKR